MVGGVLCWVTCWRGSGVTLTGGMPRQLGVYIRIIVPVCFHSFAFEVGWSL